MVVTIPKLQREDLAAECQMKGKATKYAPFPQCHHSLGRLGLPKVVLEFMKFSLLRPTLSCIVEDNSSLLDHEYQRQTLHWGEFLIEALF